MPPYAFQIDRASGEECHKELSVKTDDPNTEIERKLDASIKEAESLLAASRRQEVGGQLDTSRIKKVASDMQAQSADFKIRVEEAKLELEAARKRHGKPRSATLGRDMILYLVGIAALLLILYVAR